MQPVKRLINDLELSIAEAAPSRREHTLRQVTDLLLSGIDEFTEDQIDVFEIVIARLALAIETRARAELSTRLADHDRAPRGILRSLAHDQIEVARPVLTRSERLTDEDLIAVAIAKGREHMLAICERKVVNEPVTDVLVARGDRSVVHSIVGNPGARFTGTCVIGLVDRCWGDQTLQALLERRSDLPESQTARLIGIAESRARQRLAAEMPASLPAVDMAVEKSAQRLRAVMTGGLDYTQALDTIGAIEVSRPLDEVDVAGFALADQLEETICALASVTGLPVGTAERLFTSLDSDLLLVVGKGQGWTWETMTALLQLRDPGAALPHHRRRAMSVYEDLSPETAQRVLNYLKRAEPSRPAHRRPQAR